MKTFKSTNHHELRQRVALKLNKVTKTDQSFKKMCDINIIVSNAKKTGVLSHQRENIAQYIDNTQIPSLLDAQKLIRDAQESFMSLPSQIRKLMDHDPTKLVEFINDSENYDILCKHGILEKVEKITSSDPTKAEPALEKTVEKAQEV